MPIPTAIASGSVASDSGSLDQLIVTSLFLSRNYVAEYVHIVLVRDYVNQLNLTGNQQSEIAYDFWTSGSSDVSAGQDIKHLIVTKLALDKTSLTDYDIRLLFQRIGYQMALDIQTV